MNRPARWRPLRCTWVYTVLLLGLLHNAAFSDDPVCLGTSEGKARLTIVAFSPDGKWLAAWTGVEIVLWDFATKEKVATLTAPNEVKFNEIAFSPDSERLVYLQDTGRVGLWDGSAGWTDATEREVLGRRIGSDGRLLSGSGEMAISPDGTLLAVSRGSENVVRIVEIGTGKGAGELDVDCLVDSIQFADEGKVLVVGTPGYARHRPLVQFWNMETLTAEEPLRIQNPPRTKPGCLSCAVLSPTEEMLAVRLGGHVLTTVEVRLYELPSRRWVTLASNPRITDLLSFSPDGRLLAVPIYHGPGDPAAVLVWDLTAKTWRRFDCPPEVAQQNAGFWNSAFSPDGRYLAGSLIHPEVAVCIWDLQADEDQSDSTASYGTMAPRGQGIPRADVVPRSYRPGHR